MCFVPQYVASFADISNHIGHIAHLGECMNVMGLYLKTDTLRIVTLSGTKTDHKRIGEAFHKISVPRDNNPDTIKALIETLNVFLESNGIELIGVNGRNVSGRSAGSPLSFKSEGILIAILDMQLRQVFAQTIRATDRKRISDKSCRPATKDLGIAYDVAFELLPE